MTTTFTPPSAAVRKAAYDLYMYIWRNHITDVGLRVAVEEMIEAMNVGRPETFPVNGCPPYEGAGIAMVDYFEPGPSCGSIWGDDHHIIRDIKATYQAAQEGA